MRRLALLAAVLLLAAACFVASRGRGARPLRGEGAGDDAGGTRPAAPSAVEGPGLAARGARPAAPPPEPSRPTAPADPFLRDDDGSAIRGHVRDAQGRPLVGVQVSVEGHAYAVRPTDDRGRYAVVGPEPGPARLVVRWGAFDVAAPPALVHDVVVAAGPAVTRVDLVVDPVPSIEGRVVGPDGAPRAGVGLDLVRAGQSVSDAIASAWLSSGSAPPPGRITVRSGPDGAFRFLGVPEGTRFDVVWWDDDRDERVGARDVASGARDLRIEVAARHGAVVRCVDAETGEPVEATVAMRTLSVRTSSEEASLGEPSDDGFRARPGERLQLVAQAARYAPRVVEHVVRGDVEMEVVVVRMHRSPVHAGVLVGAVDEGGVPWPATPSLAWTVGDSGVAVHHVFPMFTRVGSTASGRPPRDVAIADGLPTGRLRVRPATDEVGLPTSDTLRFALPGERSVDVPLPDEDEVLDLTLPRGGALRVAVVRAPGGAPLDPGDMTSLSATVADGTRVRLRLFRRPGPVARAEPGRPWAEGTGAADAYETQALPPGPVTVHWTGGRHEGTPTLVSVATRVVAGEVADVEIVDPR